LLFIGLRPRPVCSPWFAFRRTLSANVADLTQAQVKYNKLRLEVAAAVSCVLALVPRLLTSHASESWTVHAPPAALVDYFAKQSCRYYILVLLSIPQRGPLLGGKLSLPSGFGKLVSTFMHVTLYSRQT
jgi:hypothetical protein